MSSQKTGHAYGIGLLTLLVGLGAGIVFYQMYYLPESLAKPAVDEHILHPTNEFNIIKIIKGSASPEQADNYVPKLVNIQLGIDNHIKWVNDDDTPHTVTPDHRTADGYSGDFGSSGVIKPGEEYEFLFTEAMEVAYHCEPHPWMKGTLEITKQRF